MIAVGNPLRDPPQLYFRHGLGPLPMLPLYPKLWHGLGPLPVPVPPFTSWRAGLVMWPRPMTSMSGVVVEKMGGAVVEKMGGVVVEKCGMVVVAECVVARWWCQSVGGVVCLLLPSPLPLLASTLVTAAPIWDMSNELEFPQKFWSLQLQ